MNSFSPSASDNPQNGNLSSVRPPENRLDCYFLTDLKILPAAAMVP
jgi:hypothetical protein